MMRREAQAEDTRFVVAYSVQREERTPAAAAIERAVELYRNKQAAIFQSQGTTVPRHKN